MGGSRTPVGDFAHGAEAGTVFPGRAVSSGPDFNKKLGNLNAYSTLATL
jgi:hypothetical protein